MFQDRTKLETATRACKSKIPPSPANQLVVSWRCCGRRPSDHPAEPLGKDLIDLTIWSTDANKNPSTLFGEGGEGMTESW